MSPVMDYNPFDISPVLDPFFDLPELDEDEYEYVYEYEENDEVDDDDYN